MTIIRTWNQQRKSSITVRWIEQRKIRFLKLVLKNIKKWIRQKRNNVLKITEKNLNRWMFPKKKQLLSKIAEHSRKRYHSMDCKKKEKHLNTNRNQLPIA